MKFFIGCLITALTITAFAKMPTDFNRQETNKEKIQQWLTNTNLTNSDKGTLNVMLLTADVDASKISYAELKKIIIDFSNTEAFAKLCPYKKGDEKFEAYVKILICNTIANVKRFQHLFEFVLKDTYMEDCIALRSNCFNQRALTKYYTINKATFRKHFKLGVKGTSKPKYNHNIKRALNVLNIYKEQIIEGKLGLTKEQIAEDLRFAKLLYFPNMKDNTEQWKPVCVQLELMIKANQ